MNEDRDALIHACLANPLDDGPRLVLSDWLEESGWNGIPLDGLRGKGNWSVFGANKSVRWLFDIGKIVRDSCKDAEIEFSDNRANIFFGGISGLPTCVGCERVADLLYYAKDKRWACCSQCGEWSDPYWEMMRNARRERARAHPDLSLPASYTSQPGGATTGYTQDQFDAMSLAMQAGLAIPSSWVREQLGIQPPPEYLAQSAPAGTQVEMTFQAVGPIALGDYVELVTDQSVQRVVLGLVGTSFGVVTAIDDGNKQCRVRRFVRSVGSEYEIPESETIGPMFIGSRVSIDPNSGRLQIMREGDQPFGIVISVNERDRSIRVRIG